MKQNFIYLRPRYKFNFGAITSNAVIFASFLTGMVLNTLFSASGYRIAMKICKDCVLKSYETVKKFDHYVKTSRKFERY